MQSDKNNLLEISKAEANKWIRYGLKKNEEEEVNNLLLVGNEDILMESFHKKLEFGTGGMRGLIGIGSNRICLLYTSPSPRDLSTSRMPSSA